MDDIRDIASFYDSDAAHEHTRLEWHQLEWELTWRYLNKYLPAQGSILEVGAATGRYTLELARRGYAVTAVDLSPVQIEINRQNLADAGMDHQVHLLKADARDLSTIEDGDYDAVLMMGPLYHLVEEADRQQALRELLARLSAGGVICTAFISRLGILGDLMRNVPGWIEEQAEVRGVLERGRDPEDYPHGGFRGYFARVEEIAPLHEALGCETMVVAGVEPAISADDESYNRLEGALRQRWLDLLFEVSTEPSTLGASRHLLYIGKKR